MKASSVRISSSPHSTITNAALLLEALAAASHSTTERNPKMGTVRGMRCALGFRRFHPFRFARARGFWWCVVLSRPAVGRASNARATRRKATPRGFVCAVRMWALARREAMMWHIRTGRLKPLTRSKRHVCAGGALALAQGPGATERRRQDEQEPTVRVGKNREPLTPKARGDCR